MVMRVDVPPFSLAGNEALGEGVVGVSPFLSETAPVIVV